ncbi:aspartate kinase [Methylosinus sp. Sm6]|uniref:amino acid kinase family protein n=1 Tax=Methylosinus sp. Sm6 TaxID=2866948 RepID=UPI001C990B83|nr:aspartate kinase [Methylosinus sp. Sm6]MBY6243280.1 aspartate kinase [Methylosinus sp. Sm6]
MPPTSSPSPEPRHLVAKLGGSLWTQPDALRGWLAALLRYAGPLTIVPGGGPFADAVREAQAKLRFSDAAAHEMAIMGMEQYALALADLEPGLVMVSTPREAALAHRRGAAALWRPVAMTRSAPQIPASWDMTSDSLAAWHAREAGAEALLLIKSVDVAIHSARANVSDGTGAPASPSRREVERRRRSGEGDSPSLGSTPPRTASRSDPPPPGEGGASLVDRCFAHYARGLAVVLAGPADLETAGERASRGAIPGAAFEVLTREQHIA